MLVEQQVGIAQQFGRAFAGLSADVEDVFQETVLEILQKIRSENFCLRIGWEKYLRWLLSHRLRDRLRVRKQQQELQLFEELAVQAESAEIYFGLWPLPSVFGTEAKHQPESQ
ncbi:MAG: hypothetical protein ACKV2Q_16340 [Planctomycetaceae bacterium]